MAAAPGARGAAPGGGAAAAPAKEVKPFEPYRDNPFLPLQGGGRTTPRWYRYGPRWSQAPIGLTLQGLPRPERPKPKAAPPPPAPIEKVLRVSSIAWAGGQPMATYETPDGKTGIVKPGEYVGEWQVVEILRDRIRVRHRKTGQEQDVYLRPKEKLPQVPAAQRGAAGTGRLPSPQMGAPGMVRPPRMGPGGGGAMPPGMMLPGMPPPGEAMGPMAGPGAVPPGGGAGLVPGAAGRGGRGRGRGR